jgi:formate-dependent phosphoribosylglycinamide formyltransferase (GAR transformylase)
MPHVTLVAPHFLENTNRYVAAFAQLEGVTLSLISADPVEALPPVLRAKVAGHYRVRDIGDGSQLAAAAQALGKGVGRIDRLTGALEQLQLPMAHVREVVGIPGMRPDVARRFRDKDRMKAVLREAGVPVAKSALVYSQAALEAFIGAVGYPVIVKPQAGLGAKATQRVESPEDVRALARLGMAPTPEHPVQVEQFVRAREHTCETVSVHGKTVWRSGTRYFPTPLEVLEQPWQQYCVMLPREVDAPWTEFAPINEAALKALFGPRPEVTGTALTHMEWFLREDGSMLVNEVGARPPGVQIMPLMGLAHDMDFISAWAELIAFDRFTPRPRVAAAGAAFFRGQGRGQQVVAVHGLQRAVEEAGDALVVVKAPRVGQARASSYEGEGYALVKADTTDGVKRALLALVGNVRVEYGG